MDNESPNPSTEAEPSSDKNTRLLKKMTERFRDTWVFTGALSIIIFSFSSAMGVFTRAYAFYLIPLMISGLFYWCWKLLKAGKALVVYVYLIFSILEYAVCIWIILLTSRGLSAPFAPDLTAYILPGIILAVPDYFLFKLKKNNVLHSSRESENHG